MMANLDENYLKVVRSKLYNSQGVSKVAKGKAVERLKKNSSSTSKGISKKSGKLNLDLAVLKTAVHVEKPKIQITSSTDEAQPSTSRSKPSKSLNQVKHKNVSKITNRECTPFRRSLISPSQSNNDELEVDDKTEAKLLRSSDNYQIVPKALFKNSKKRLLTSCDSDEVIPKKKKSKNIDRKLNQQDKHLSKISNRNCSNGHSTSNATDLCREIKHKKSTKNKTWDITEAEPLTSQQALMGPKRCISPVLEDLADFYDDETVNVQGLKVKRFFNLFAPTHNYQSLSTMDTLQIPKKFFSSVQAADEDTSMDFKVDSPQNRRESLPVNKEILSDVENDHSFALDETFGDPLASDSSEEILQQSVLEEEASTTTIIRLKDYSKIIVLELLNEKVHFNGLFCLKVLNAEIEIMGAYFNKNSSEVKLYSPRGTSLLYLRNCGKLYADNSINLKDLLPHHLLTEDQMCLSFKQHCAIVLCQELQQPYIDFIESHIAQKIFPDNAPKLDFQLLGNFNKIETAKEWNTVVKDLGVNTKVAICGGKGVGKSTFLRYAINTLLKQYGKVTVVDLDPGQSELNPPGSVSVSTVKEYILGPNYTHLQTPDISILAHINIDQNIQLYLKTVQILVQSTDWNNKVPILINFPGFTQELGMDIAANILQLIEPAIVVEIKSTKQSKNYKMELTVENVTRTLQTSILMEKNVSKGNVNFQHVSLESLSEKNNAWSLHARQSREFCILAYFGKMMTGSVKELSSPNVDMFSINLSEIKIVNQQGKPISPLAVNANMVALCSISLEDPEVFISYGYGFVRGMDLDQNVLVLLTPEPIERLEKADHLVLSSVTMPPSLIMSTSNVKSQIPYLNTADFVEFGQLTKRSYVPPKK